MISEMLDQIESKCDNFIVEKIQKHAGINQAHLNISVSFKDISQDIVPEKVDKILSKD